MIKIVNLYTKHEMLAAFEFGFLLADVAKTQNVELTVEIVERAERIFLAEIRKNGWKKATMDLVPLALACFETK